MITKTQALALQYRQEIYFLDSAARISRCRVNGKCKVWKRDPEAFQVPVKYGLRTCGYIKHETRMFFWLTLAEAKADPLCFKAPIQPGLE